MTDEERSQEIDMRLKDPRRQMTDEDRCHEIKMRLRDLRECMNEALANGILTEFSMPLEDGKFRYLVRFTKRTEIEVPE